MKYTLRNLSEDDAKAIHRAFVVARLKVTNADLPYVEFDKLFEKIVDDFEFQGLKLG